MYTPKKKEDPSQTFFIPSLLEKLQKQEVQLLNLSAVKFIHEELDLAVTSDSLYSNENELWISFW